MNDPSEANELAPRAAAARRRRSSSRRRRASAPAPPRTPSPGLRMRARPEDPTPSRYEPPSRPCACRAPGRCRRRCRRQLSRCRFDSARVPVSPAAAKCAYPGQLCRLCSTSCATEPIDRRRRPRVGSPLGGAFLGATKRFESPAGAAAMFAPGGGRRLGARLACVGLPSPPRASGGSRWFPRPGGHPPRDVAGGMWRWSRRAVISGLDVRGSRSRNSRPRRTRRRRPSNVSAGTSSPSRSRSELDAPLCVASRTSSARFASFAFFASFFAFFASLRKSLSTSSFATILIPESMAPDARRALAAREGEEDAGVRFRRCRTKSCWLRTESQPSGQRANDG